MSTANGTLTNARRNQPTQGHLETDLQHVLAIYASLPDDLNSLNKRQIKHLQTELRALGFEETGRIDGIIGPKTLLALSHFTEQYKDQALPAKDAQVILIHNALSLKNLDKEAVKQLQTNLRALGFEETGRIDGIVGPKTLAAIDHFTSQYSAESFQALATTNKPSILIPPYRKATELPAKISPEIAVTPNTDTINYGLKMDYTPRNLQRALIMAGYDIGSIDGDIGDKTNKGISQMFSEHPGSFRGMSPQSLPEIYQRIKEVGIDNLLASDDRITLTMRAIDTENTWHETPRTKVLGEAIFHNPKTGEEFYIIKDADGTYSGDWLSDVNAENLRQAGNDVFHPEFNSGGLNFRGNGRASQRANGEWNPYNGSALPGLSGGTAYGLEWESATFNGKLNHPSFGDKNGNESWIYMTKLDSEAMNGRDRIGMHVDGNTANGFNDGTAGCPAFKSEYAAIVFAEMNRLRANENLRPNHVRMAAPSNTAPLPDNPAVTIPKIHVATTTSPSILVPQ